MEQTKQAQEQDSKVEENTEEKVKTGPEAYLEEFQKCLANALALSCDMSGRQCRRVLQSLLKAPFEPPAKMVDVKEQAVFSLGVRIMDIKMLLVTEQLKEMQGAQQMEANVEQVREEAERLEKEEGNKNNG